MKTLKEFNDYCDGKTIAVVGNAVVEKLYGASIDACDIVLRFNEAYPSKAQEPYIGSKSNVWSIMCQDLKAQKAFYETGIYDKIDYLVAAWWRYQVIPEFVPKVVHLPLENFCASVDQLGASPSCGYLVLRYLMDASKYKKLVVAGFDFFESGDRHLGRRDVGRHNPEAEKLSLTNLLTYRRDIEWLR